MRDILARFVAIRVGITVGLMLAVGCGGSSSSAPQSSNSDLSALTISLAQPLSPAFDAATRTYAVGPAVTGDTVVVTATAEDAGASITVDGLATASGADSAPLALGFGTTTVTVRVTAEDGSASSTTLTIDRTSAALSGLACTAGNLGPAFDPAVLSYTVRASVLADATALTPTAADSGAQITVNAAPVTSGDASAAIPLDLGMTVATVEVTARDGSTSATYTVVLDRSEALLSTWMKASNAEANDRFGDPVAISGDTAVIGASQEDSSALGGEADNSAPQAGAAYVFVRSGTTWSQQAFLKASNALADDRFGGAVTVDGDTLVVGAQGEGNRGGAAYVFTRTGTTWTEQAYLKASNAEAGDQFGCSVALTGDTLVVGARLEGGNAIGGEADNSASQAGAAYVFVRSGTTWSQQAYLKASNAEAIDRFGEQVAISGDTVVVGALLEDSSALGGEADNSAENAGAAYVFVRTGTTWSQQAYLKASNAAPNDTFGASVAVSGDTLLVGAYGEAASALGGEADNSAPFSGAAYVFARNAGSWSQQAYLKAANADSSDFFGSSVALSGNIAVVGAYGEASNGTAGELDNSLGVCGAVYVFVFSGGIWGQEAWLKASNPGSGDTFGRRVAIGGGTVLAGAPGERSNGTSGPSDNSASSAGAAYAYR